MTRPTPTGRDAKSETSDVVAVLRAANLRPTRQRRALATLLFGGGDRHVTAERLHEQARDLGISVSLATVYNALHQFTEAGLLRELVVDADRAYFDTNTRHHHHFYDEKTGVLTDFPGAARTLRTLPEAPTGSHVTRVDIVVRVSRDEG
jgi:Fur family iron response transcriptional regulator